MCLFSLLGQWALFTRFGPLLLSTRGREIGTSQDLELQTAEIAKNGIAASLGAAWRDLRFDITWRSTYFPTSGG